MLPIPSENLEKARGPNPPLESIHARDEEAQPRRLGDNSTPKAAFNLHAFNFQRFQKDKINVSSI
ncbi:MAG: hypothetical protein WCB68_22265 [Pyrinomonadaceae bacterium]